MSPPPATDLEASIGVRSAYLALRDRVLEPPTRAGAAPGDTVNGAGKTRREFDLPA